MAVVPVRPGLCLSFAAPFLPTLHHQWPAPCLIRVSPISTEVSMILQTRSRASFPDSSGDSPFSGRKGRRGHPGVGSLFEPDVLTSATYRATHQRQFQLEPERVLMLAVLEDAIICFQDNVTAVGGKPGVLFKEAEDWILNEDDSYLYSFENICDELGFDPMYLRQGLIDWKEVALTKSTRKLAASR
jgi:hypothetical protein